VPEVIDRPALIVLALFGVWIGLYVAFAWTA
jgi:hypothetical protein